MNIIDATILTEYARETAFMPMIPLILHRLLA
jgi:hypothetical protein